MEESLSPSMAILLANCHSNTQNVDSAPKRDTHSHFPGVRTPHVSKKHWTYTKGFQQGVYLLIWGLESLHCLVKTSQLLVQLLDMAVSLSGEGKVCQVKGHTCPNTNEKGWGIMNLRWSQVNDITRTYTHALSRSQRKIMVMKEHSYCHAEWGIFLTLIEQWALKGHGGRRRVELC